MPGKAWDMTGLKVVLGAVVLVLVAGTPVDCQGQELRLTTPAAVEVGDILRIKASSPGDSTTVTFEVKGANGATVSAKLNQSLSQQAFDPQTKRLLVETVDYNRALTLSYTITPTTPPASPVSTPTASATARQSACDSPVRNATTH